jgi:hypothetical protein
MPTCVMCAAVMARLHGRTNSAVRCDYNTVRYKCTAVWKEPFLHLLVSRDV